MSKFITAIPVAVQSVLKLLPAGAYVESIRYNARDAQVEIIWDHGPYQTGVDFPLEFPPDWLAAGQLPKCVKSKAPALDIRLETLDSGAPPVRTSAQTPVAPRRRRREPAS